MPAGGANFTSVSDGKLSRNTVQMQTAQRNIVIVPYESPGDLAFIRDPAFIRSYTQSSSHIYMTSIQAGAGTSSRQSVGHINHRPGSRPELLSTRPTVTFPTVWHRYLRFRID